MNPASSFTRAKHADAAAAVVSLDDPADFERARRGLIATMPTGQVTVGDRVVWDVAKHDLLRSRDPAPDTVHPGLWRQGQLNAIHGLFEVSSGVWQARGYDISNITFMASDDGWVIIDPLTTGATAAACLKLANDELGERPVSSVIYTHSHTDHYGGILGVTTREAVAAGEVRIIAPEGFMTEVVNETMIGGAIMARRASFQFAPVLPTGPMGQIDGGLGVGLPGPASSALIAPTETISETGAELDLGGIRVIFQNTPDAEAPAEMNFFFPDHGLLCMAENCCHTMHNLYPIRGAQVRDSLAWSKYIQEALLLWGSQTNAMFASHHWPRFGRDDVREFLELQRDVYRWLHDQAMRLANKGHVPTEIAAELSLPEAYANASHVQGYYGTVSHNVRSVYNRYLGWYDGNPANLDPLPPVDAGERYVEFMGGPAAVVAKAQQSYDAGEYRWVAQVVNHVVFADAGNTEARMLLADAYEQLGYQSESSTWRSAYLQGAHELRHGGPAKTVMRGRVLTHAMTVEQIIDSLGVRFDPAAFPHSVARLSWRFTDLDEEHVLGIARGAVHHIPDAFDEAADARITTTRSALADLLGDRVSLADAVASGEIAVDGDADILQSLLGALEVFMTQNIVEP